MTRTRMGQTLFLSFAIGVGIIISPAGAEASTGSGSASQIAALQGQVALLKAQLTLLQSGATFTFAPRQATFDQRSYTSVSHYPTLSGTATVDNVFVLVRDSKGVALSGTVVPVEKGHWSFASVVALPQGAYTVELSGGSKLETRTLEVIAS